MRYHGKAAIALPVHSGAAVICRFYRDLRAVRRQRRAVLRRRDGESHSHQKHKKTYTGCNAKSHDSSV